MTTTQAAPASSSLDRAAVTALSRVVAGPVLSPGDPRLTDEVAAFNLATSHAPALSVGATCGQDVAAAVRFALAHRLPVAVQATGHGAVMPADGAVLITTSRMQQLSVDPARRTARVGAGVRWSRVIEAAAPYGLAPLSGSSSSVGVVGYTLGGGIGPLGRRYGYAADHVRSVEIVTGDGELRTATPDDEPELFWAVRGGKGNVGVVTSIELDLMPVDALYGGGLFYSGDDAAAVLHAWRTWVQDLPEETTTSVALLRLPDRQEVPPPLRGRLTVHLRVAHCGDPAEGARLVEPMRSAAPVLVDLLRELPFTEVDSIHMDPTDPLPYWEGGRLLSDLPGAAVDAALRTAGPAVDVPLVLVELRHLGGALARPPAVPNAVAGRDGRFLLFVLGPDAPGIGDAVRAAGQAVLESLAPFDAGHRSVNFLGHVTDPHQVATSWEPEVTARLAAVKAQHDPHHLFRVGHCLPAGAR